MFIIVVADVSRFARLPTSIRPEPGVIEPNLRPYESESGGATTLFLFTITTKLTSLKMIFLDDECDMPTFITQKRRQKSQHPKKVRLSAKLEEAGPAEAGDVVSGDANNGTDVPVDGVASNTSRRKTEAAPIA